MQYKHIIIGIDQSYVRCGISIAGDGKVLHATSISYKATQCNSSKRKQLSLYLCKILDKAIQMASRISIICERIRTFTGGGKLRPNYLISTGALIATIVDTAFEYSVPVFSVDTRAWKSKVVGTNKPEELSKEHKFFKYANKLPTLRFVKKLGYDCYLGTNKNGKHLFNDDKADSICIALYGFIPKQVRKLKLES